jgi:hypothetical protein
MTRNLTTAAARRTVTSTLAALVLAVASSQAGFAQGTSDAQIWKVDPANSKISSGSAALSMERASGGNQTPGGLVVISKGNVYLVTNAAALSSSGLKVVDSAHMKAGKAVLIGTNVRSTDYCALRCQWAPPTRITVTFTAVDAGEKLISDMLAYDGQKK